MGFNSVVMICNDALGEIRKDPEGFANKIVQHVGGGKGMDEPFDFGHGNHLNGFQIAWNQHADVIGLVTVGGNHASVIGTSWGNIHHTPEGQIQLLRELARKFGYHLTKNRIK